VNRVRYPREGRHTMGYSGYFCQLLHLPSTSTQAVRNMQLYFSVLLLAIIRNILVLRFDLQRRKEEDAGGDAIQRKF
jgi:hypothetical protein